MQGPATTRSWSSLVRLSRSGLPSWYVWRQSSRAPVGSYQKVHAGTNHAARYGTSAEACQGLLPALQCISTAARFEFEPESAVYLTSWPRPLNTRLNLVGKLWNTSGIPRCSCRGEPGQSACLSSKASSACSAVAYLEQLNGELGLLPALALLAHHRDFWQWAARQSCLALDLRDWMHGQGPSFEHRRTGTAAPEPGGSQKIRLRSDAGSGGSSSRCTRRPGCPLALRNGAVACPVSRLAALEAHSLLLPAARGAHSSHQEPVPCSGLFDSPSPYQVPPASNTAVRLGRATRAVSKVLEHRGRPWHPPCTSRVGQMFDCSPSCKPWKAWWGTSTPSGISAQSQPLKGSPNRAVSRCIYSPEASIRQSESVPNTLACRLPDPASLCVALRLGSPQIAISDTDGKA